jgi:hypothetical protein
MGELNDFREWAVKLGHYHTIESVDRYLMLLENRKAKLRESESAKNYQKKT